ncbi:response regulator [Fluviispira multicolorata]|uniref:Response regulator n=1 Tax=Fluviispira multicolorata TaxID=2654512 RepID=A0A833N4W3_9BACT|nr:response regulator [Fluviispira multicolorata]KAB8029108.1 response regulator [Fluviispira multicolorata]
MSEKNIKILIIDDSELDTYFISEGLKNKNFECVVLNETISDVEIVEKYSVNLILLDILMPNMDGNMFLEKIRVKYNKFELPIIMITSLNDNKNLEKSMKLGANDYISKPVNIDIAATRINNQIMMSKLYKENLQKKEIETINSIIITYNHEINNSLTIAQMALKRIESKLAKNDLNIFNKAKNALKRIEVTVKKIKDIEDGSKLDWEIYADNPQNKILK